MKHKSLMVVITVALAISCVFSVVRAQDVLNQFNSWTAISHTNNTGNVCFATSKPNKLEPTDRKHGAVHFFVTNRPKEGVFREPSVVVGYNFKENSEVKVDVDGTVFTLFTHNDGAWLKEGGNQSESQLIEAIKAGHNMVVSGESARGTKTKYTFSLSGVTAAIKAIDQACP